MRFCILRSIANALLIVLSLSCAGQVSPSGGPPDTTPPRIIRTNPPSRTTQFNSNSVTLEFSEYVDRRSVADAIFISPSPGKLRYDWNGSEVTITFGDSLRPNTTYILTLGTDVTDLGLRGSNRMAEAFALPFSTGDIIDTGSIHGRVFDADPHGIMVFGYRLDHIQRDTLDPRHTRPDFLTQTGKDGAFHLVFLPPGVYRVVALRDEFKNLFYDPQTDAYGTMTSDIELTEGRIRASGVRFRMTKEDTTAPFLSSARAMDRTHVLLRFSEPLDERSFGETSIVIDDTISQAALTILDLSATDTSGLEAQVVTSPHEEGHSYRVRLNGLLDRSGNSMSRSGSSAVFVSDANPDTTLPQVSPEMPLDSLKSMSPGQSVTIAISEPVLRPTFERGFSVRDSADRPVEGVLIWNGSARATFSPNGSWTPGKKYSLRLVLDSVVDYSSNARRDSTMVIRFQGIDQKYLSSIGGHVNDTSATASGPLVVIARSLDDKLVPERRIVLDSTASFILGQLREGRYTLSAFRDVDGNGVYSHGKPAPFQFSEPFADHPDTLKLRARWPLEGVVIQFR